MSKEDISYVISEITSADFSSDQVDLMLDRAIEIQKNARVSSDSDLVQGFVVTVWDRSEWVRLIHSGSRIFLVLRGDGIVSGYIVVSPMSEFQDLLRAGGTVIDFDASVFKYGVWKYIYQIVIDQGLRRRGLGMALLKHIIGVFKEERFVSDYMIEPHQNKASAVLFETGGFKGIGTLKIGNYRGCSPTTWAVVTLT